MLAVLGRCVTGLLLPWTTSLPLAPLSTSSSMCCSRLGFDLGSSCDAGFSGDISVDCASDCGDFAPYSVDTFTDEAVTEIFVVGRFRARNVLGNGG